MDWLATLKSLAPTVATAVLGPMGGMAVSALGNLLGIPDATQSKIADAIKTATLTPEQVVQLKQLELEFKTKEQEMGVKFSEIAFQDRDSARKANVAGGAQRPVVYFCMALVFIAMGLEFYVFVNGVPDGTHDIIAGRVLGFFDMIGGSALAYLIGTTVGSQQKNDLLVAK
jgi:hypothetical protein